MMLRTAKLQMQAFKTWERRLTLPFRWGILLAFNVNRQRNGHRKEKKETWIAPSSLQPL